MALAVYKSLDATGITVVHTNRGRGWIKHRFYISFWSAAYQDLGLLAVLGQVEKLSQESSALNLVNLIYTVDDDIYWSGTIEKCCQEAGGNCDAILEVSTFRLAKCGL